MRTTYTDREVDGVTMRTCIGACGLEKPLDEFPWKNKAKGWKHGRCKVCAGALAKAAREKRADHYKAVGRAHHHRNREARNAERRANYDPARTRELKLLANYGITLERYEGMLAAQGGVCALCRLPETAMRGDTLRVLAVDHCHATGAVRELLCDQCNTALGKFRDDPALMRAAADYVERHAA